LTEERSAGAGTRDGWGSCSGRRRHQKRRRMEQDCGRSAGLKLRQTLTLNRFRRVTKRQICRANSFISTMKAKPLVLNLQITTNHYAYRANKFTKNNTRIKALQQQRHRGLLFFKNADCNSTHSEVYVL